MSLNPEKASRLRNFFRNYRARVLVFLLFSLLFYAVYAVCSLPAGDLFLPEWGAKRLLPFAAAIALTGAAFGYLFLSFFSFIGYHAGILIAMKCADTYQELTHAGPRNALLIFLFFTLAGLLTEGIWYRKSKKRKPAKPKT